MSLDRALDFLELANQCVAKVALGDDWEETRLKAKIWFGDIDAFVLRTRSAKPTEGT